mmetsp:Transcript_58540/g.132545  ORF Transcript_58540/g.132545 Transcript_58540/m.132545 type:complete len:135 (-) Transcript_58540:18-422(-)
MRVTGTLVFLPWATLNTVATDACSGSMEAKLAKLEEDSGAWARLQNRFSATESRALAAEAMAAELRDSLNKVERKVFALEENLAALSFAVAAGELESGSPEPNQSPLAVAKQGGGPASRVHGEPVHYEGPYGYS